MQTIEPVVALRKDYGDEHLLTVNGALDSLSGGSPNGAIPSRSAQTFSTPSAKLGQTGGKYSYTTAPGDLPLDTAFKDMRLAVDAAWAQPLGTNNHGSIGGHLSKEHDFLSAAGSVLFSRSSIARTRPSE